MIQGLQAEVFNLECWAISNIHCWDVSIREHEQLVDSIALKEWDAALALLEQNRSMSTQDFSEFVGTHEKATGFQKLDCGTHTLCNRFWILNLIQSAYVRIIGAGSNILDFHRVLIFI